PQARSGTYQAVISFARERGPVCPAGDQNRYRLGGHTHYRLAGTRRRDVLNWRGGRARQSTTRRHEARVEAAH
ncbi:MAG: hypothetical protein QOJ37_1526, partial [Pseudonocardiales bacterium]|nr:hypothetical protein [Pseudonocardiales bacterium]